MSGNITDLTDDKFKDVVEDSKSKPVLIDFWAPWCGPCQILGPMIEEVANELGDSVSIYKMDVDENPQTAGTYGIMSIPTVMIFKDGEVRESFIGVQSKEVYLNALKKYSS